MNSNAVPSIAVGIDFGTSSSLVAVYEHGRVRHLLDSDPANQERLPWTPSLVSVMPHSVQTGADQLAVGWAATSQPLTAISVVKRYLGHPKVIELASVAGTSQYRPEEIAALILRRIVLNARRALGTPISDVVLSVPANFGGAARQALLTSAKIAGLNPLRLINEPTAAALSYLIHNPLTETKILVFDFGGGTLDISILHLRDRQVRVLSTFGNPYLGGIEFDREIINLLKASIHTKYPDLVPSPDLATRLPLQAEKIKRQLSKASYGTAYIANIGSTDTSPAQVLNETITREMFETAIAPHLRIAHQCLNEALRRARLQPSDIDRVVMVGGTSLVPAVQALVHSVFDPNICVQHDPIGAVVEGAALRSAQESGMIAPEHHVDLLEVAGKGIGICAYSSIQNKPSTDWPKKYYCLIAPNQRLPFQKSHRLTIHKETMELKLSLYEGDVYEDCPWDEQRFVHLTTKEYTVLPAPISTVASPSTAHHEIKFDFIYTENAIIDVTATIPATTQTLHLHHDLRATKAQLDGQKARVCALWEHTGRSWEDEHIFRPILRPPDWSPQATSAMVAHKLEQKLQEFRRHLNTAATLPSWNHSLGIRGNQIIEQATRLVSQETISTPEYDDILGDMHDLQKQFPLPTDHKDSSSSS